MANPTRAWFEDFLNNFSIPEDDKKSNGGRIPDFAKYGSWLRRNDPIAFNVAYQEELQSFTNTFTTF